MAKQNDKEITLSVLKTVAAFLNSEGGTLLIGVQDNGDICGVELDKYSNIDKFQVALFNYLKTSFNQVIASSIKTRIHKVENKTVCEVRCPKSKEPVYLNFEGSEDFYIRSGPSSEKLKVSQVKKYIDGHF